MLQKAKVIKALENRIKVFSSINSKKGGERYYHECCSIVWFLKRLEVFTEAEAIMWIEKIAEASYKMWIRLALEEEGK